MVLLSHTLALLPIHLAAVETSSAPRYYDACCFLTRLIAFAVCSLMSTVSKLALMTDRAQVGRVWGLGLKLTMVDDGR